MDIVTIQEGVANILQTYLTMGHLFQITFTTISWNTWGFSKYSLANAGLRDKAQTLWHRREGCWWYKVADFILESIKLGEALVEIIRANWMGQNLIRSDQ